MSDKKMARVIKKDELSPALNKLLAEKFMHKTLGKMATNVRSQAVKNVMRKKKYDHLIQDRGDLAKSIQRQKVETNFFRVNVTEPHGVYVHEGTKPHMPPFRPIKEWVSRKLGVKEVPQNYLITRAIRLKIAKHGTKGRPFLSDAMETKASKKELETILNSEIEKAMKK